MDLGTALKMLQELLRESKVEAYRAKIQAILEWEDDARQEVHNFAKAYSTELDRRIVSEQKRADENVEMRRRQFDSDEGSSPVDAS